MSNVIIQAAQKLSGELAVGKTVVVPAGYETLYMRAYDGYLQISKDEETWENVLELETLQGETGPQGPQGPQGVKGDNGEPGPQGPQGEKGDKGDQGVQGPQGVQGQAGPQGPRGETGPQGPQGEVGPQGATGPKGSKGDQGIQGIQGEKGDKGDKGEPGDKGDKGDKGDQGETGATGEAGVSPTVTVSKEGKVTTISITDAEGTKEALILDGEDGTGAEEAVTLKIGFGDVSGFKCDYICDGTEDNVQIQEAILALPKSGGTIILYPGTYNLARYIDAGGRNNVKFETYRWSNKRASADEDMATLKRGAWGSSGKIYCLLENKGKGWVFDRIKFVGNDEYGEGSTHYTLYGDEEDEFISCAFSDWQSSALTPYRSKIIGCRFTNNYRAIEVPTSAIVDGNYFEGNKVGVYSPGNCQIINNTFKDNTIGIDQVYEAANIIMDNHIIRGEGTPADYTEDEHTIVVGYDYVVSVSQGITTTYFGFNNVIYGNHLYGKDVTILHKELATEEELAKLATNVIENNLVGATGGGGGVSSWNDLPDKPFEEKLILTEIFGSTTVTDVNNNLTSLIPLEVDKEYMVEWDGIEYRCKCSQGNIDDIVGLFLGNAYFITQSPDMNTGEPFILGTVPNAVSIVVSPSGGTHTFKISSITADITPLDNKFIDAEWMAKTKTIEVLPKTSITLDTIIPMAEIPAFDLVLGEKYILILDDVEFEAVASSDESADVELFLSVTTESGKIGVIKRDGSYYVISENDSHKGTTHTVAIKQEAVPKLPEKYLPEEVATKSFVEELLGGIENGTY